MTNETPYPERDKKKSEYNKPEDTGIASQKSQESQPGNYGSAKPRSRKKVSIPNIDEILTQLHQLNGAVLMGSMSVKDANFIQKNLKTLLDVQLKRSTPGEASGNQEALADVCRRDPRSLEALEPFLSDDQIRTLMSEIGDDPNESL